MKNKIKLPRQNIINSKNAIKHSTQERKKTFKYSEENFDPLNKTCYNKNLLFTLDVFQWRKTKGVKI